jgi:hypothetical protein
LSLSLEAVKRHTWGKTSSAKEKLKIENYGDEYMSISIIDNL